MDFFENLNQYYEKIIRNSADVLISDAVKKVVQELKKINRSSGNMQTPEDCVLKDLWDEVCVQLQREYFIYWDLYEDLIYDLTFKILKENYSDNDIKMMALQGEEFNEWYDDAFCKPDKLCFDEDGEPENFDYQHEAVILIVNKLLELGGNYRNKRIEQYLESDYEL